MPDLRGVPMGIQVLTGKDLRDPKLDIVAIHGRAAHPDYTWSARCQQHGIETWRNWLTAPDMLPEIFPNARIMRFGYHSQWAGEDREHVRPEDIANDLINELGIKRRSHMQVPLILIAHSFGGIALMQAIVAAKARNSHAFQALIGIVFFGTPFRGNSPTWRDDMICLAQSKYRSVYGRQLQTSSSDSEYLKTVTSHFISYLSTLDGGKPRLTFFFERKRTDIRKMFSKDAHPHELDWVTEEAACLDLTDRAFRKHGRSCDHFQLNKFDDAASNDFQVLKYELLRMVDEGPARLTQRQLDSQRKSSFVSHDSSFPPSRAPQGSIAASQTSDLLAEDTPPVIELCSSAQMPMPCPAVSPWQQSDNPIYELEGNSYPPSLPPEPESPYQPPQPEHILEPNEPSFWWSLLQFDERWIRRDAQNYWQQITVLAYHTYAEICGACQQTDKGRISFDTLYALLNGGVPRSRVEQIWRRLLPSGKTELMDLVPEYVLVALFMLHVEQSGRCSFPPPDCKDERRRKKLRRWTTWVKCACSSECNAYWNFANDKGLVDGSLHKCLVYQGLRKPPTSIYAVSQYQNLVKAWLDKRSIS